MGPGPGPVVPGWGQPLPGSGICRAKLAGLLHQTGGGDRSREPAATRAGLQLCPPTHAPTHPRVGAALPHPDLPQQLLLAQPGLLLHPEPAGLQDLPAAGVQAVADQHFLQLAQCHGGSGCDGTGIDGTGRGCRLSPHAAERLLLPLRRAKRAASGARFSGSLGPVSMIPPPSLPLPAPARPVPPSSPPPPRGGKEEAGVAGPGLGRAPQQPQRKGRGCPTRTPWVGEPRNRGERVPTLRTASVPQFPRPAYHSSARQEGDSSGSHDGAGGSPQSWGCRWQEATRPQPMASPAMPSPARPGMGVPQAPQLRSEAEPWPLPTPDFVPAVEQCP